MKDVPNVDRHLAEALQRACNGYVELISVEETRGYMEGDYYVSEYSGAVCMAKPGAVSTSDSTHLDTLTDLTKFVEVPDKNTITAESIYQIWMPGKAFRFSGKGYFLKTENGWQIAHNYHGPVLSTTITPGAKPSEYFIFKLDNNEIKLLRSDSPYMRIEPPANNQVREFTLSHVEYLTDGIQKMTDFKIISEPVIDRLLEGGEDGYVDAKVMLTFVQPAVSLDGENVIPAPKTGDNVSDNTDYEKGCYWETGVNIPYEARIRFRKQAFDDSWTFSTMSSITPVKTPLKSEYALRVVCKDTADGKIVRDATPVLK